MKTLIFDPRDPQFYNPIINSNFDFWQRLDASAITRTQSASQNGFGADRMYSGVAPGGISKSITIQRSTDVPTTQVPCAFSHQLINNTATGALTGSEYLNPLEHLIEGSFLRPLAGMPITVGFWIEASVPGTYTVALRRNGASRSYVTTVTVNASNVWEYKAVNIPFDASGPAQAYGNIVGWSLVVGAVAGSTLQASTLNTWLTGNFISHSSATNWANTSGAAIRIAQIQIRSGFRNAEEMQNSFRTTGDDYKSEFELCQRYCQSIINVNGGNQATAINALCHTSTTAIQIAVRFGTPMRIQPVMSFSGTTPFIVGGGSNSSFNGPLGPAGSLQLTDVTDFIQNANSTAALVIGNWYRIEYPGGSTAGSRILFEAEF